MAVEPPQPNILQQLRAEASLGDQVLWVAKNSVGTVQAAFLTRGEPEPGKPVEAPIRCWDCISGEDLKDLDAFKMWVRTTLGGRFFPDGEGHLSMLSTPRFGGWPGYRQR